FRITTSSSSAPIRSSTAFRPRWPDSTRRGPSPGSAARAPPATSNSTGSRASTVHVISKSFWPGEIMSINQPSVVLVLGAGPGLGQAVGKAFVEAGAKVVLMARDYSRLEAISAEIGAAGIIAVDATDESALRAAFADV